jgi:hypothetical protein
MAGMMDALLSPSMSFSILDHLDSLEKSNESGKYQCPACGGNDFTVNKNTGGYNCWHDPSPAHRAEIRDALAPLTRWEKPSRDPGVYQFDYRNSAGQNVVKVHRDDTSGSKKIWQEFPTIEKTPNGQKAQLQEVKAKILPYRYHDAIAKSKETGLPIFIVEGELTCEAMWAIELPAVTFLGGSKQYRTNGDYSQLFRNVSTVLCPDRDQQGVAFMTEVATDNPGAQWLYADPRSWEWDNLPPGNGYDIGDYIEEGATKDDLLASIGSNRHKGKDGKPSYDEIISTIEGFVGLYANEARISYETNYWLEQRGVKMSQQNVEKIIDEAKLRVHGKEEIESIDALTIASSDKARDWLIAGIVPLGSVTLLAAAGGTGKTTLLYNWALHVALGTPWSGRRCMKGKSLLISADEPLTDTAEKLSVIGYQDAGLSAGDISFWETWRFANMQQLEDYIRKERPSLVMIDSLTACLAGMNVDLAKSSAGDAIYGLRDMANAYRCSIVILHHLNKSGGLRDSTSFVDNVSEVVKLTRAEGNFDPNEFTLEWLKSRSGLTGKHSLQRDPLNYGWRYAGPLGGSLQELDQAVNTINMRKNERFTKQQVAALSGSWDVAATGKMLEVARRQGLITSSFQDGPNGEKQRLFHSWDYSEPEFDFTPVLAGVSEEEDFF